MSCELYQLPWREVSLRKYEREEVPAAFSVVLPELVTLDEDGNIRTRMTHFFAVIARSGVAAEMISMTSSLANDVIGSGTISVRSFGGGAALTA